MPTVSDSLPPHSDDAERGVLACMLLAPEQAATMIGKVQATDFYDLRHRTLFSVIASLLRAGTVPNTVAVAQSLHDNGMLENAGGTDYLTNLPDAAPSASNFEYYLPILKEKANRRDLLALSARITAAAQNEKVDSPSLLRQFTDDAARMVARDLSSRTWVEWYSPSQLREWQVPAGYILVGDCHVVRGSVTVIAGAPGVGKSRASTALAVAGAVGGEWLGLKVHQKFKTAILQAENGRYRLKQEFAAVNDAVLDNFIRVSDRPPFGLAFDAPEFRHSLTQMLQEFNPDVLILDPWNAIARDDKQRDYRAAFDWIFETLPKGDRAPAIVIVAHTRKPKGEERKAGRDLLHELAGSHNLGSVPRCVFVMEAATNDPADDRVVMTCCKNNDGDLGARSAWYRQNGFFGRCDEFDWQEFDLPGGSDVAGVSECHLEQLFDRGRRKLAKKHAVEELKDLTKLKHTACYNALSAKGRFAKHLTVDADGLLCWQP